MKYNYLLLLLLSASILCNAADLETSLEDGTRNVNTLKGQYNADQLQVLTSLHQWGSLTSLAMGQAAFTLISDDENIEDDEIEMSLKSKLNGINQVLRELEKEFRQEELSLKIGKIPNYLRVVQTKIQKMNVEIEKLIGNHKINEFFEIYEKEFADVSKSIYFTLAQDNKAFHEVAKFHANHKKRTFQYMKATTVLLLKSIAVDLTYNLLKNGTGGDDEAEEILQNSFYLWNPRLSSLSVNIRDMETYLTSIWKNQYTTDIKRLMWYYGYRYDSDSYAKIIHSFLEEKYFWRKWYVVVMDTNRNFGVNYNVEVCNGLEIYDIQEKNVYVSSKEQDDNLLRKQTALLRLGSVSSEMSMKGINPSKATTLKEKMGVSCGQFPMFGAINEHYDVAIYGDHIPKSVTFTVNWFFKTYYKGFIMV